MFPPYSIFRLDEHWQYIGRSEGQYLCLQHKHDHSVSEEAEKLHTQLPRCVGIDDLLTLPLVIVQTPCWILARDTPEGFGFWSTLNVA